MGSETVSAQGLQVLVAYLEGKGVEVDQLKRALEKNDSASVESWFETSYRRHVAKILGIPRQQPGFRTSIYLPEERDRGIRICDAGEGIQVSISHGKSRSPDADESIQNR